MCRKDHGCGFLWKTAKMILIIGAAVFAAYRLYECVIAKKKCKKGCGCAPDGGELFPDGDACNDSDVPYNAEDENPAFPNREAGRTPETPETLPGFGETDIPDEK